MAHMPATFRENVHETHISLDREFKKDIQWLLQFLLRFNRIIIYQKYHTCSPVSVHLDTYLSGIGSIWTDRVYSSPVIPIQNFKLSIMHWERQLSG